VYKLHTSVAQNFVYGAFMAGRVVMVSMLGVVSTVAQKTVRTVD
jgi:hypothetical protein